MKILLTGGGTAGHIMPHLALMNDFRKHFDEITYIGSRGGMEKNIITKEKDIVYHEITASKFVRKKILRNLLIPFKLIKSIKESKKIIKEEKPNVVFSKGGYVSLPVVVAAKKLKVPVVAHESDLKMGLANRLSKPYAKVICTTFEKTAEGLKKGVYTGSAIRQDMFISQKAAKEKLNIVSNKPILVITGGSLGAKFINEKIRSEISEITKKYYVIHITGKNNIDPTYNGIHDYKQIDFTLNIGTIISAADIVVSRAGSNTIFELAVNKKPMLLIPLPKGNSRGDQVDNAEYFKSKGYACVALQEELTNGSILDKINKTFKQKDGLIASLKTSGIEAGNQKILDIILQEANIKKEG